ncbi:MAG: DUF4279 domain-containing protein, partial [Planctomycetaceae bacterium]|nr:DUF4279 domain-containing protein [Planctomycetaceae bacterium]
MDDKAWEEFCEQAESSPGAHTFSRGAFLIGSLHPFNADVISEVLGINPNYLWQQQKPHLIGLTNFPQMTWGYQLPLQEYESTDDPVNELLEIFLPKKDILVPFVA